MKKKNICSLLLLCASLSLHANPISKAEARQVAQTLVGIDDMSDDNSPLSPIYIFSRGAGKGFVIVSGDDSTTPILGVTDQGDYDESLMPLQLKAMLDNWRERIAQVQQTPQPAAARRSVQARAIADYKKEWTDVSPLVKTHWHQDAPYNNLAPIKEGVGRCMTGCVATAGSQVAYYFHKDNPSELQYDTPTYGYGTPITVSLPKGTPLEWNLMRLSGNGTAAQNNAVATLMYALGTSAWLTYGDGDGTATSGHNYKMADALSGQLNLTSSHKDKTSYSQKGWEELIYKNLTSRRPMLYSGVHPDNGGHSVVLDGYQASTGLYHFNFGWGGQGDGYYTVDDETGMNGFNSYQDLICDFTPKVQNLEAHLGDLTLYHKADCNIAFTVANNGTLDYQGLYVYINTKATLPSKSIVGDLLTPVEAGTTKALDYTVSPTIKEEAWVFVCDKNKRILDSCQVFIQPTVADLHLNAISIDAGEDVVTLDGQQYSIINSTTATVTATLTNGSEGTYCQPTFQCIVEKYDPTAAEWTRAKSIVMNKLTFEQGQTCDAVFTFPDLDESLYYRARLNKPAVASEQREIAFDTPDSLVYFTVRKSDLTITVDGRNATVSGRWNAAAFEQNKPDSNICSYDITQLTELNTRPQASNPNAVFYAAPTDTHLQQYDNVVVGDVCEHLVVTSGHDFHPAKPFTARRSTFVIDGAEPGQWHSVLIPFATTVPYGMQVKVATGFNDKGTVAEHAFVRDTQAMAIVTCLTSRSGLNSLVSENVTVTTDSVSAIADGQLRASTVSTILPEQSMLPGIFLSALCFLPSEAGTTVDAFMPVVSNVTAARIYTSSELLADGYYATLSRSIDNAYTALEANRPEGSAAEKLQATLTAAEDMLTYRSHQEETDIKNTASALDLAVKAYFTEIESGIDTIAMPAPLSEPAFYSISGQRLTTAPLQGVYIIRQGGKTYKVIRNF